MGNRTTYFHTEEGIEDNDMSLDWDPLHLPRHTVVNLLIPDPTSSPWQQQLEAYLWQAQLGHCGEWQLKVIPHAVDGTPKEFTPHPL